MLHMKNYATDVQNATHNNLVIHPVCSLHTCSFKTSMSLPGTFFLASWTAEWQVLPASSFWSASIWLCSSALRPEKERGRERRRRVVNMKLTSCYILQITNLHEVTCQGHRPSIVPEALECTH